MRLSKGFSVHSLDDQVGTYSKPPVLSSYRSNILVVIVQSRWDVVMLTLDAVVVVVRPDVLLTLDLMIGYLIVPFHILLLATFVPYPYLCWCSRLVGGAH
jgi:hypothetical protein